MSAIVLIERAQTTDRASGSNDFPDDKPRANTVAVVSAA
jgi:hypothetical protein